MNVQSVDNQNRKKVSMPLVITSAVVGGVGGAFLSPRCFSEGRLKAVADLDLRSPAVLREIADCFDLEKAESEMKKGSFGKEDYDVFKSAYENIVKSAEMEEGLQKAINIPAKERNIPIKEALKNANKTRMDIAYDLMNVSREFAEKMQKLRLINVEKLFKISGEQSIKMQQALKLFKGPIALGALVGTSCGAVLGLGLSALFNKNK